MDKLLSVAHSLTTLLTIYNFRRMQDHTNHTHTIVFNSLFLRSSSNLRPYRLFALLVRNLSFFQAEEVCWNRETGSLFFFFVAGLFNLNVQAAVISFCANFCQDIVFLRQTPERLGMTGFSWFILGGRWVLSSSSGSSLETSSSSFLSSRMGAEVGLKLKTADLGQLLLGMQSSLSSSSYEELEYILFLFDIQLKIIANQTITSVNTASTFSICSPALKMLSTNSFYNHGTNFDNLISLTTFMLRSEQKASDRYFSERNNKFSDYSSKQMHPRSSKQKHSRIFSNVNKPGPYHNYTDLYPKPQAISQQQINTKSRGASINRNNSKSKYAESMSKFRKQFIKESYINFDYEPKSKEQKSRKDEVSSLTQGVNLDEDIGLEELHYQMVKLHQNVKKLQYHT